VPIRHKTYDSNKELIPCPGLYKGFCMEDNKKSKESRMAMMGKIKDRPGPSKSVGSVKSSGCKTLNASGTTKGEGDYENNKEIKGENKRV